MDEKDKMAYPKQGLNFAHRNIVLWFRLRHELIIIANEGWAIVTSFFIRIWDQLKSVHATFLCVLGKILDFYGDAVFFPIPPRSTTTIQALRATGRTHPTAGLDHQGTPHPQATDE